MEIDDFAPLRGNEWAALWPVTERARVREAVSRALSGERDRFEAFCPTVKGTPKWWDVAVGPVQDATGHVVRVVASSRDITDLKRTEERLRDEVTAREDLVREADHRIKNSLQMVAGLLRLQQNRTEHPEVAAALEKATARVLAVAEAHRGLYQSSNLRTVNLCQVLQDLALHLGALSPLVAVRCVSSDAVIIDAERGISLGLIANELLTNAVTHAYPKGEQGIIEARINQVADDIILSIADQGRGLPVQPNQISSGLGSALVRSLARQVGASVITSSEPGQGTTVTLRLPKQPIAKTS